MNTVIRYSGIAAISVSLIMLSIGSMPQANAGTVGSSLLIDISCGLNLVNPSIDFDIAVTANAILDNEADSTVTADPTLENPGTNVATSQIKLSAGDAAIGGYAGISDNITHIPPSQMSFDFQEDPDALVALDDTAIPQQIGTLIPAEIKTLHAVIDTTPVNVGTGITDTTWDSTIDITVVCAVI